MLIGINMKPWLYTYIEQPQLFDQLSIRPYLNITITIEF